MSRGMIIGHSFVAGLADHLAGQHGLPDGKYRSPSEVASDLRVSDQMDGVFLSGVGGASLCDGRYKLPTIAIDNERPHFVVLQFGTNDLACGVPPYEVACEVLNTAHELVMDYGVMRVVICGALYRVTRILLPLFFIWMLAAVWWHCGQGLMRVLLDSDWSTPDRVSSEILKTDSSSFLLNPQPMQTCAMIVPRLMTTCLWAHICNQQLLLLLQVSLLYYVLMYITCIARGAYCIFVNMVFKVIAPCLCIFCPL